MPALSRELSAAGPLSARGHIQARRLADVLADAEFDRVLSSPYVRCMESVVPLASTRGLAIFVTLMAVMLGGAWIPTFLFPQWMQKITVLVPTRWAIDGLEAMTWRGLGLGAALAPIGVLLAFAVVFGGLAVSRYRWEEA